MTIVLGDFFPEWLLFALVPFALWIGVVVLIGWALIGRDGKSKPQRTSALRLLEERYARGEVTRDEFLERRRVLEGETTS